MGGWGSEHRVFLLSVWRQLCRCFTCPLSGESSESGVGERKGRCREEGEGYRKRSRGEGEERKRERERERAIDR